MEQPYKNCGVPQRALRANVVFAEYQKQVCSQALYGAQWHFVAITQIPSAIRCLPTVSKAICAHSFSFGRSLNVKNSLSWKYNINLPCVK